MAHAGSLHVRGARRIELNALQEPHSGTGTGLHGQTRAPNPSPRDPTCQASSHTRRVNGRTTCVVSVRRVSTRPVTIETPRAAHTLGALSSRRRSKLEHS